MRQRRRSKQCWVARAMLLVLPVVGVLPFVDACLLDVSHHERSAHLSVGDVHDHPVGHGVGRDVGCDDSTYGAGPLLCAAVSSFSTSTSVLAVLLLALVAAAWIQRAQPILAEQAWRRRCRAGPVAHLGLPDGQATLVSLCTSLT